MPDNADNLQVNQPNVINIASTNWPEPLTDPSNKLKMTVTDGTNGSQSNKDLVSTSQQDEKGHQLAEGYGGPSSSPNSATSDGGGRASFDMTSQEKRDEHSTPESN